LNTVKKLLVCLACLLVVACSDEPSVEAAEAGTWQSQTYNGQASAQPVANNWSAGGGAPQAASQSNGNRKLHPKSMPKPGPMHR